MARSTFDELAAFWTWHSPWNSRAAGWCDVPEMHFGRLWGGRWWYHVIKSLRWYDKGLSVIFYLCLLPYNSCYYFIRFIRIFKRIQIAMDAIWCSCSDAMHSSSFIFVLCLTIGLTLLAREGHMAMGWKLCQLWHWQRSRTQGTTWPTTVLLNVPRLHYI